MPSITPGMSGPSFGISPEQMQANALQLAWVGNKPAMAQAAANKYGYDQQTKQSEIQAALGRYQSDQGLAGQRYGADSQLRAQTLSSNNQLAGLRYGADQQLAGLRYGEDAETARLNANLGFKNDRFNQLFPFFQSQLGGAGGGGGGGGYAAPAPPAIPAARNYGYGGGGATRSTAPPVYDESQIQQRVNAAVGRNDAKTAGAVRRQGQDLAGRGLGANSPLAMALKQQALGAGLRAGTDLDRETRMEASRANAADSLARHQTGEQTAAARFSADRSARANEYGSQVAAAANQYGNILDHQARLAAVQGQRQNALLAALAGMMG